MLLYNLCHLKQNAPSGTYLRVVLTFNKAKWFTKKSIIPFRNVIWVFIKLHNERYVIWTIQMNSSWNETHVIPTPWSFDDPTLRESGSCLWIRHQLTTLSTFRPSLRCKWCIMWEELAPTPSYTAKNNLTFQCMSSKSQITRLSIRWFRVSIWNGSQAGKVRHVYASCDH